MLVGMRSRPIFSNELTGDLSACNNPLLNPH
jgi:hypothetical protein